MRIPRTAPASRSCSWSQVRTSPIFSAERYFLPTLRFREPLGILPSCFPLPIENDRVVGRKVSNVRPNSPKLVGAKERAGSLRTNIKFNQIAQEEYEKVSEMGAPEIKVRVEPDEDLSNFQCREIFPPNPEIQRATGCPPQLLPPTH